MSWVERYPCKLGTERELKKKIDETRRLLEEEKAKEEEAEARVKAEKAKEAATMDTKDFVTIILIMSILFVIIMVFASTR